MKSFNSSGLDKCLVLDILIIKYVKYLGLEKTIIQINEHPIQRQTLLLPVSEGSRIMW